MNALDIHKHLTGDQALDDKLIEWFQYDRNTITRKAIQELLLKGNLDELRKILINRLTFGTAGIRGRMGPGYGRMNDLVIIQTSQGLASYLLNTFGHPVRSKGVIIGHDARYGSFRFARLAALAFMQKGIPVYLYSSTVPTPFVPFGVILMGAIAGIMVTASHNPKADNGYKVYFGNGAQIIPPHDSGIQSCIEKNLKPWPEAWDINDVGKLSQVTDPLAQVMDKYYRCITGRLLHPQIIPASDLRITFTSLHGVGHEYASRALSIAGFKHCFPVPEQMMPDPDFPTVTFPNPEEGKGVLNLSIKTADATNSHIILANDPDVDRLAVAEKDTQGSWRCFTGNEIGALLGWWLWFKEKQKFVKIDPKGYYMFASAVSSKILESIAKVEGFNFIETLTGFKWMGNHAIEYKNKGKMIVFAFEEAIGYMCSIDVPDKDGLSAAVEVGELAAYLRKENGSKLMDKLNQVYEKYGFHCSLNSYYLCYEQEVISRIFKKLANAGFPKTVAGYKINRVRDLNRGFDSATSDNKPILPCSKSSFMITYYFENGIILTIRTSGTEPKIKYYSEVIAKPEEKDWSIVKKRLKDTVEAAIEECLEPKKNGLIPKSE